MSRFTKSRPAWWLTGAVAAGLAAGLSFAALSPTSGHADNPVGTPVAKSTPTPFATPVPPTVPAIPTRPAKGTPEPTPATPTPEPTQAPQPEYKTLPLGTRVKADPVRVQTGDGDCLNVRPNPGTTFATEPNTCLPEGSLLWLHGDIVKADNETWRYALGSGWIATRLTKAAAAPAITMPAGSKVALWQLGAGNESGTEVTAVHVDVKSGAVVATLALKWKQQGIGGRNPEISPDGRFVTVSSSDYTTGKQVSEVLVGDIAAGTVESIPDAYGQGWTPDGTLALSYASCEGTCTSRFAFYDPAATRLIPLTSEPTEEWASGLGEGALYVVDTKGVLSRLDARGRTVIATLEESQRPWNGSVSPDGRRLMGRAGNGFGIVNLSSGALSSFSRAPQRQSYGKCGGSFSIVQGWLDNSRFFYHERGSEGRQDGITIVDTNSGAKKLFPNFNVQDMRSPAPGMLSFAAWETLPGWNFQVTFLLDTATGESLPLWSGAGATWVK